MLSASHSRSSSARGPDGTEALPGACELLLEIHTRHVHFGQPLNCLLVHDAPWSWTDACQEAFLQLREALLNSPVLVHYDPS